MRANCVVLFVLSVYCACIHSVAGGECCRSNEGTFWCPDYCCYRSLAPSNTGSTVTYSGNVRNTVKFTTRFYCCSSSSNRAPRGFTTGLCSSWFSHPDNLWIIILVVVLILLLFFGCGLCCCCCPGQCKSRRFSL